MLSDFLKDFFKEPTISNMLLFIPTCAVLFFSFIVLLTLAPSLTIILSVVAVAGAWWSKWKKYKEGLKDE